MASPRAELAKVIPRRATVTWWSGLWLAAVFTVVVVPLIAFEGWVSPTYPGARADYTVRTAGGIVAMRGETVPSAMLAGPRGGTEFLAYAALVLVLATLFTHHMRRSGYGRLLRVQIVSLAVIAIGSIVVKVAMLTTAASVFVVPVALFAMVPTLALDRVVGLATGTLAALIVALLVPFDLNVSIVLLAQVAVAGLVIDERPKRVLRTVFIAGAVTTACTALIFPLLVFFTTGAWPSFGMPWLACAIGPAAATFLTVPLLPLYQRAVGEITHGQLVALEDLSHPLLRQIAEKAPGTWQHSLMMANMAELAANAIGANGRLVRVGAYFHDLGKSLQPKYFIENLEPGETSPHDKLPPEVSCDAIFAHVTEGIVTARKAGLHERIVDFMHMHHGNGVLEYFWAKCQEQGNPKGLTVENFRYPGFPPQSRETAILAICDAVEAAARTLKKPDAKSIEALVQRIVYGKLHLGQLDESGLSMRDLRCIADSLRETIRHANHNRIEYPWQKAQQDASATPEPAVSTSPRLDSLDRPAKADVVRPPAKISEEVAVATTANVTPDLRKRNSEDLALMVTAPVDPAPAAKPEAKIVDDDAPDSIGPVIDPPRPSTGVPVESVEEDTGRRKRQPGSEEVAAFAAEARHALESAQRDVKNIEASDAATTQPVMPAAVDLPFAAAETQPSMPAASTEPSMPVMEMPAPTPGHRKRAATLPPTALARPPTMPPGRRAPTIPPLPGVGQMTLPPPSSVRPPAAIPMKEGTDGVLKVEPDFGGDTPPRAPTRAELQALLDSPPDPTRKQSIEELELDRMKSMQRPSEPELFPRRAHPTTEVHEEDIEAAIELAPQARKGAVGVAKKKPE
ncbi:MAG: HDIG domain-containing protein [Deltaproteobacteria bacterium]|nr:HDIG domain-containing protein [Deltaproteobacteria bacterium]